MSSYQQNQIKHYYENRDTMALQNLAELASELFITDDDPKKEKKLWKRAAKAAGNTDADPARVEKIVEAKDVKALSRLVNELTAIDHRKPKNTLQTDAPPLDSTTPSPPTTTTQEPIDPTDKEVLKKAMKAFRKRLKLTRLDEESGINSRSPLTSGRNSGIVAITPPNQYPTAVWEALAEDGRLKKLGKGFYTLADE